MPPDDAALWVCDQAWRRRVTLEVTGPTGATADLALDKEHQLATATEAGLVVPPSMYVRTVEQLLGLSGLPVVLKPAGPVAMGAGRLTRAGGCICENDVRASSRGPRVR
jgi:hypothetical protein